MPHLPARISGSNRTTTVSVKTQPVFSSSDTGEVLPNPHWLSIVRERVHALRYGTVQIVIHEGRVTQVDSTERTRLPAVERLSD
jgi:hypothetical protein